MQLLDLFQIHTQLTRFNLPPYQDHQQTQSQCWYPILQWNICKERLYTKHNPPKYVAGGRGIYTERLVNSRIQHSYDNYHFSQKRKGWPKNCDTQCHTPLLSHLLNKQTQTQTYISPTNENQRQRKCQILCCKENITRSRTMSTHSICDFMCVCACVDIVS
jgi:hypothetical protein